MYNGNWIKEERGSSPSSSQCYQMLWCISLGLEDGKLVCLKQGSPTCGSQLITGPWPLGHMNGWLVRACVHTYTPTHAIITPPTHAHGPVCMCACACKGTCPSPLGHQPRKVGELWSKVYRNTISMARSCIWWCVNFECLLLTQNGQEV